MFPTGFLIYDTLSGVPTDSSLKFKRPTAHPPQENERLFKRKPQAHILKL